MQLRTVRFLNLLFAGVISGVSISHVAEMWGKLDLSGPV